MSVALFSLLAAPTADGPAAAAAAKEEKLLCTAQGAHISRDQSQTRVRKSHGKEGREAMEKRLSESRTRTYICVLYTSWRVSRKENNNRSSSSKAKQQQQQRNPVEPTAAPAKMRLLLISFSVCVSSLTKAWGNNQIVEWEPANQEKREKIWFFF